MKSFLGNRTNLSFRFKHVPSRSATVALDSVVITSEFHLLSQCMYVCIPVATYPNEIHDEEMFRKRSGHDDDAHSASGSECSESPQQYFGSFVFHSADRGINET